MSPSARTATWGNLAWRWKRIALPSGQSIWRAAITASYAIGPAQPQRHGLGAGRGAALDRRQRARRARQRPGSGLPDVGARGAFYGWPYSYCGQHVDARVKPQRPDLVATAVRPTTRSAVTSPRWACVTAECAAARPMPTACSSASTARGTGNRERLQASCSWRSRTDSLLRLPVQVLAGFVSPEGTAWGRPVGVALDRRGALLVADDVGNTVWRVTTSMAATATRTLTLTRCVLSGALQPDERGRIERPRAQLQGNATSMSSGKQARQRQCSQPGRSHHSSAARDQTFRIGARSFRLARWQGLRGHLRPRIPS